MEFRVRTNPAYNLPSEVEIDSYEGLLKYHYNNIPDGGVREVSGDQNEKTWWYYAMVLLSTWFVIALLILLGKSIAYISHTLTEGGLTRTANISHYIPSYRPSIIPSSSPIVFTLSPTPVPVDHPFLSTVEPSFEPSLTPSLQLETTKYSIGNYDLKIQSLLRTNAKSIDVENVVISDKSGIAISPNLVYLNGRSGITVFSKQKLELQKCEFQPSEMLRLH
jgi:hypothetical protein